nr:MAG: hypothetical protein [Chemarfal virus 74]
MPIPQIVVDDKIAHEPIGVVAIQLGQSNKGDTILYYEIKGAISSEKEINDTVEGLAMKYNLKESDELKLYNALRTFWSTGQDKITGSINIGNGKSMKVDPESIVPESGI